MKRTEKQKEESLEGFICPVCKVRLPTDSKLQEHYLKFHVIDLDKASQSRTSRFYEQIDTFQPASGIEDESFDGRHYFMQLMTENPRKCVVCNDIIWEGGIICQVCSFACHSKCQEEDNMTCKGKYFDTDRKGIDLNDSTFRANLPKAPKSIKSHFRHLVSKGRARHVHEKFDLDLTYITDRIIAMAFPASGLEVMYRNSLKEVAEMLREEHGDYYMVFNVSERSYDISKLNNQVLDFGWPDHYAPPLDRLCSICKSIDSWLKSDEEHVVVVHCKGGKGRTGVVIAAYMLFSEMFPTAESALDWFAKKRFYNEGITGAGVTQPSQKRYVFYFSDILAGKFKVSGKAILLHHVILHGIPNFDNKGGCRPFLRIYQSLQLLHTSDVYTVSSEMERVCITIDGGLELNGDVLVQCFHKNALTTGADMIFRCQFHTDGISDFVLVLGKTELDNAIKDKRFPDNAKVELIFSEYGKTARVPTLYRSIDSGRHSPLNISQYNMQLEEEFAQWTISDGTETQCSPSDELQETTSTETT